MTHHHDPAPPGLRVARETLLPPPRPPKPGSVQGEGSKAGSEKSDSVLKGSPALSESGDSGLMSGSSSVRSGSVVSTCSSGLEELLLEEQDTGVCRVQRQLEAIQVQKEQMMADMGSNESLGRQLRARLASELGSREMAKVRTFLSEQEKVVLLLLSLTSRLERAEEELVQLPGLAPWEREGRGRARDAIRERLGEAGGLSSLNHHRLLQVLTMLEARGLGELRDMLLMYVSTKEELLRVRTTCDQLQRTILL